jgi:glycosyltransferase involved in cell wall biosynthesis
MIDDLRQTSGSLPGTTPAPAGNGAPDHGEPPPRVSVVMPVYNAERFLGEAVESVLRQTYGSWELLLIDDASTDGSRALAERYAAENPERIRFLHHPGDENRGASATRNLGIAHARGEYLALLDADDVWLPRKLAEQVPLLDAHPEVGVVCGSTRIWYSWSAQSAEGGRDYTYSVGVAPNTILPAPDLLTLSFRGRASSPCTCSLLIRRELVERVGGFEDRFRRTFTDQVLYAKLFVAAPVLVTGATLDLYRQHPDSSCAESQRAGRSVATELEYLDWFETYLQQHGMEGTEVWESMRWYRYWRHSHPRVYRIMRQSQILARKVRDRVRGLRSGTREAGPPRRVS